MYECRRKCILVYCMQHVQLHVFTYDLLCFLFVLLFVLRVCDIYLVCYCVLLFLFALSVVIQTCFVCCSLVVGIVCCIIAVLFVLTLCFVVSLLCFFLVILVRLFFCSVLFSRYQWHWLPITIRCGIPTRALILELTKAAGITLKWSTRTLRRACWTSLTNIGHTFGIHQPEKIKKCVGRGSGSKQILTDRNLEFSVGELKKILEVNPVALNLHDEYAMDGYDFQTKSLLGVSATRASSTPWVTKYGLVSERLTFGKL